MGTEQILAQLESHPGGAIPAGTELKAQEHPNYPSFLLHDEVGAIPTSRRTSQKEPEGICSPQLDFLTLGIFLLITRRTTQSRTRGLLGEEKKMNAIPCP